MMSLIASFFLVLVIANPVYFCAERIPGTVLGGFMATITLNRFLSSNKQGAFKDIQHQGVAPSFFY